jgi:hypothetical protein
VIGRGLEGQSTQQSRSTSLLPRMRVFLIDHGKLSTDWCRTGFASELSVAGSQSSGTPELAQSSAPSSPKTCRRGKSTHGVASILPVDEPAKWSKHGWDRLSREL